MKKKAVFTSIIILLIFTSFKKKKKEKDMELEIVTNEMVFFKGGEFEYHDSIYKVKDFYASKYEVTNLYYKKFINELRNNGDTNTLKLTLPDSTLWHKIYSATYIEYYFNHPAYRDYPVVTISHEAAMKFCSWLSDKYNNNPKKQFKKVKFRLPTNIEWLITADYEFHFPRIQYCLQFDRDAVMAWGGISVYGANGKLKANFNIPEEYYTRNEKNPSESLPWMVNSLEPNKYGLYCLDGNVAEMLDEPGKAKGGSWAHYPHESYIGLFQNYDSPNLKTGFRLFMEVLEP